MLSRLKAVLEILSTSLVIVAAGLLIWRLSRPATNARPAKPVQPVTGQIRLDRVSNVRGTGDVVLIEFADYECPFCAGYARNTAPAVKSRLVDAGKAKEAFIHFPLPIHPHAEKAARAAECAADQGQFWSMHEELSKEPQSLEPADLSTHAKTIGLDTEKFLRCLDSPSVSKRIQADLEEGRRLGVNGTPTFFIGMSRSDGTIEIAMRIDGAQPYDLFATAVDQLSKGKTSPKQLSHVLLQTFLTGSPRG